MKQIHGDVLTREILAQGFLFEGARVPIVGPVGIFKPQILPQLPLSITTIPDGPYDDDLRDGDPVIHYRYRGKDQLHPNNVGLRNAMLLQVPLIFCYRVRPGAYLASYPAFICGDRPGDLTFEVQVDDDTSLSKYLTSAGLTAVEEEPTARRQYVTVVAKRRLHQAAFRDRVIAAYDTRCALCRLRHSSLLDAAHIIPDNEPEGEPLVTNGLCLCKIHHAAFDQNFIGVRPDFTVEVRASPMHEVDGPMLQHGLKAMQSEKLYLPTRQTARPSALLLDMRFQRFLEVNNP